MWIQEVSPGGGAVSTGASGRFRGEISKDGSTITYTLSYSGLEGTVAQAHIYFAQRNVAGPIVVFLCRTTQSVTAPTCPQAGTVTGTLTGGKVRRCGNVRRRCSLRFGNHEPRARQTPERRRHRPWGRRAPRLLGSQALTWESLEAFARGGVQQLLQRVLEEEVDELLGRPAVRAPGHSRCADGLPQRLRQAPPGEPELWHDHRTPAARARPGGALREPGAAAVQAAVRGRWAIAAGAV